MRGRKYMPRARRRISPLRVSQERAASTAERESKSKKSPVVNTASLRARRMRRAMREGVLDW
jgi:hypothetical protein